ncbi:MAG TPA: hypothetical protein VFH83_03600 [Spirochaetia bacterium]|nr:hypothetical protein [Spirochaetia bacterium]
MEDNVGFLEFSDNEFLLSVARALADLEPKFIGVSQVEHPTAAPARVIVDRLSFCDPFLRSVVRYWGTLGARIINSPFFSFDKLAELALYNELRIGHPRTVLLPGRNRMENLSGVVAPPDWGAVEERIGFPCILKPVDGYAWQDVYRVESPSALRALYGSLSERRVLLVQELIRYTGYYRAFCVGAREVLIVGWKPLPFDRGEYSVVDPVGLGDLGPFIHGKTAELNGKLGLDFNTVEWCVTTDGRPVVIDSNNDVPDVRKEKLPASCYDWIVERFAALVRRAVAERGEGATGTGPA